MTYQSLGEKLLHEAGSWGLGSPYLFLPQKYRKGKHLREPADVAWVSDELVMLFYLQSSNKEFSIVADHNLAQAKGWLRAWKAGQNLKNTSSSIKVDLPFQMHRPIYIVSAVESRSDFCECHTRMFSQLGVQLCVSLPLQSLMLLIHFGGGYADILIFMNFIADCKNVLTRQEADDWILAYRLAAWNESGAVNLWADPAFDLRFYDVSNLIHTWRRVPAINVGKTTLETKFRRTLIRINLKQLYLLISTVRCFIDKCLPTTTGTPLQSVGGEAYFTFIGDAATHLKASGAVVIVGTVPKPLALLIPGPNSLFLGLPDNAVYHADYKFQDAECCIIVCRLEGKENLLRRLSKVADESPGGLIFIFILTDFGILSVFAEL